MSFGLRQVAMVVSAVGLCLPSLTVHAHVLEPQHEARISVAPTEHGWTVNAKLIMVLPPDTRAGRVLAMFDLNRSGGIEPAEGVLLANSLGAETVGGFVLRSGGEGLIPESIEGTGDSDAEGRVRVIVLLEYELDEDARDLAVGILGQAGGGRVESRPALVSMELSGENGGKRTLLPAVHKQPGDDFSEVALPSHPAASADEKPGEDESGNDS